MLLLRTHPESCLAGMPVGAHRPCLQADPVAQQLPEVSTAQRIEAGMAVLRNNLPGLSQGSLRGLLEKAGGDVLQALSGLTQHEMAAPLIRQQARPHPPALLQHVSPRPWLPRSSLDQPARLPWVMRQLPALRGVQPH